MAELQIPDVTWHDVELSPMAQVTRGAAPSAGGGLEGRLSLGEPVAVKLKADDATGEGEDKDLNLFLTSEAATYAYYLVRLACTFRPEASEQFAQAALSVRLTREDGVPDPRPIAWSMTPRRSEDSVEFSKTVKLGGKASLAGFIEVTAGPEASKKVMRRQIQLAALNEMQSNPTWDLRRTEAGDIDGSYLFALVVRSAVGVSTRATLGLTASVERARLAGRFFRYRAELPEAMPRELVF